MKALPWDLKPTKFSTRISKCKIVGSLCKYNVILHISYTRFSSLVQSILSIKQLAAVAVKTQKSVLVELKTPFLITPPFLKFSISLYPPIFYNILQDFSHKSSHNTYSKPGKLSLYCLNGGLRVMWLEVQKQIYWLLLHKLRYLFDGTTYLAESRPEIWNPTF